jgi:hypothetical protein
MNTNEAYKSSSCALHADLPGSGKTVVKNSSQPVGKQTVVNASITHKVTFTLMTVNFYRRVEARVSSDTEH